MKLKKFSVILVVLLIAILAMGAVSAESIDDTDVAAVDNAVDAVSVDDSIDVVSVETTDKDVKNSLSAVAVGEDNEDPTYIINDTSYSTYFNDDGTAKQEVVGYMGDYSLNIGTLTNKDIIIESGSNINITALENEGFITNGTITLGGDGFPGSIIVSGLTFTNTNKNAIEVLDYTNDITIKENNMNILGVASETSNYAIYGITSTGFVSGLYIEDNTISTEGDITYSYGIGVVSNNPDYSYADSNPQDIVISSNVISVNKSGSGGMAEAIYLDNVIDTTVVNNYVTANSVGCSAYGIQLADSSMYSALQSGGYDGDLTSPNDVLIDNNIFILNSDFMVYGITTINYGYDSTVDDTYIFLLNINITNNEVYANSKRGIMGIAGQIYNLTVINNTVIALGGSSEGLNTGDSALGNDSVALKIEYDDIYCDTQGVVIVKDNKVFTNVTKEKLSNDNYADYVIFENNIDLDQFTINDDTYSFFFNDDGTTDVFSDMGDYTLNIGTLTNKDIKIESGSNINITGAEDCLITNGTITIGDYAGSAASIIVSGLTFNNTNKNAFDVLDLGNDITIKENNINVIGITPEDASYFSIYGITVNGFIYGLYIEDNNITIEGNGTYSYGISLGSYMAEANPEDIKISGNTINMDISEGSSMAEAIYLDNPTDALVEDNVITISTVGNTLAYGIQVSDSVPSAYQWSSYRGDETSPNDVTIKNNTVNITSDYMIYGISAISSGAKIDEGDLILYAFDLEMAIVNNTVIADSKKGVIGIGAKLYNITIMDNDITVNGTSAEDVISYDELGVDTVALSIIFNKDVGGGDDDYYVIAENNNIYSDVKAESLNSEDYEEFVTFDNNIPIDLTIELTANSTEVNQDDLLNIYIKVANNGPNVASGTIVDFVLNDSFVFIAGPGEYDADAGIITMVGDLLIGKEVTYTVSVNATGAGIISSEATVSSNGDEITLTDNLASLDILVKANDIVIDDSNYDTYFNEDGTLKDGVIAENSAISLDKLTNKDLIIDIPLTINGTEDNKLVNTTISIMDGADGTVVSGLNMEFTGDENTGSAALIYVTGVSNVQISDNELSILDFVDSPSSSWGSSAYAIKVESGNAGTDNVAVIGNTIDVKGSASYLYGIDAFATWGGDGINENLNISNNKINIESGKEMSEAIYVDTAKNVAIESNNISSESSGHAYGIATNALTGANISGNIIDADAGAQAYGITSTFSSDVDIIDNEVTAVGTGAIGVGVSGNTNVAIEDNTIEITGDDYTSIFSYDVLGTANAAILDMDATATVDNNAITENCPVTIDDGNYAAYFDENGTVIAGAGISDGDLIFLGELTNKKFAIDIPLTIKGATDNKLTNTTISLASTASGSTVANLNMEFAGDDTTGSIGLIYVLGASDIEISGNNIVVTDFVDKAGAKYGSSLYAIEVESGADGCSFVDISSNNIDVKGSARYLYGIDVFQTWGSQNNNSNIAITFNVIRIDPASRMSEGIYASAIKNAVIANNTIFSEGDAAAYGIGTDSLTDSTIADNEIVANAGTQAYGITNTYSTNVGIYNNTVNATGTGAVGVGFTGSTGVEVVDNTIEITGDDYTSITSADSLGTANAAVFDKDKAGTVSNNDITENCPVTIDDSNYANYFDENGNIKNSSGINEGDLIFLGELNNKKFVIDERLTVKGAPGNKLTNTVISLVSGAGGSTISKLNMEFTGDDATGSIGLIYALGVSDIEISYNNITVPDFVDKAGAKYGSSLYAIEVESGADGASYVVISNNNIDITGSARYLYGIDVFQTWGSENANSFIAITDNVISIASASRMSEGIYASAIENAVIANNTIYSEGLAAAYGIGTDSLTDSTIAENEMEVVAGTQAYGITNTYSTNVDIKANTINSTGIGAVGVGFTGSSGVKVTDNTIEINGDDYTSITSADSLGTANAAIFDKDGVGTVSNNTVTENCPVTIDDSNYATYFDENGNIKSTSGLKDGDLIFLGELNNKKFVIDERLTVKGAPGNKLTNTVISLVSGADGSTISKLNMEFTGDNTTGSIGLIYALGVSDIEISYNNITVPDFVDKAGAKYGSSLYAIEVESGADGCSYIVISNNKIDVKGSARYLYGIDVFQTWGSEKANSYIAITDNVISIDPASRMSEAIYASAIENAVIANNTIFSEGAAASYGIGTDSLTNSTIADNEIEVIAGTQAYGITNTYSTNVDIYNNTIKSTGTGAVGVGFTGSDGVKVTDNTIEIDGDDYTSITSADSLGTANAAILDKDAKGTVANNTITENCPVTITDDNYATYFDEEGKIKNTSGIKDGDLIFIGELSNKDLIIDMPLTVKGAPGNKLTNTTIAVKAGADGTSIENLNIDYTDDGSGYGIISVNDGASDIYILSNNITAQSATGWNSAMGIVVYGATPGSKNITIADNKITITGDEAYTYGIDIQNYDPSWTKGEGATDVVIANNEITLSGNGMEEAIYLSNAKDVTVSGNTISSESTATGKGNDAYAIGVNTVDGLTIEDNTMDVKAKQMAFGVSITTSSNDVTVANNNITAEGTGAIGVGTAGSTDVTIADNTIDITGGDYTSIETWDSLGTANAAILDKTNAANITNNNVSEDAPVIVDDASYDKYFDENGIIKDDAPISAGDTLLIGKLSDKNLVIDIPLTIKPASTSKLTDSTIKVVEGGDGTVIDGLDIEYTGDEETGSVNIISVVGASDVTVSNNNIVVPDFVNKAGAKYGSTLAAILVESGASGTDNVTVTGNNIEINGSANYLYGIDAYTTWGANTTNSNLTISDNNVTINGGARMAEAIYVSDSEDVTISDNSLEVNSDATGYGIGTDQLDHAKITGNDVGVSAGTAGYGITATTDGEDILIESNDVNVVGTSAIGVGLSGQDTVVVKDNKIEIVGEDYSSVSSADNLGTANAAILDKDNKNTNLVLENNTLKENGKAVNTTHSGNSSAELQAIIDAAKLGSTVDLGGVIYADISNVVIDKNLTITNGTIVGKAGEPIFVVPAKSAGGPDEVNITGVEFLVNNANTIVKATADNGTSPTSIDTPAISIKNNTIDLANDDVVAESVTVLELESERGVLAPTSEIAVEGNTLASGVDPFEFKVTGLTDENGDTVIGNGSNIPERTLTQIHYNDMNTVAINQKIEGRVGKYFYVNLTDINGKPLVNKTVQIGFNGAIYNRTTNETGGVRLQINLGYKGTYTFAVSYLGDEYYNGSFVVAKIVVSTQKTKLTTAKKTYKASAKTKTLTATLKDASGHVISGKKVTFTVNGKSYSATTNSKGVATVKVSLSTKKTYSFTAKYAGDDMYTASSVSGKVTIK